MRTTLNIDDDVLVAAKEIARREKKSLGQVISDLTRRAFVQGPGHLRATGSTPGALQDGWPLTASTRYRRAAAQSPTS